MWISFIHIAFCKRNENQRKVYIKKYFRQGNIDADKAKQYH